MVPPSTATALPSMRPCARAPAPAARVNSTAARTRNIMRSMASSSESSSCFLLHNPKQPGLQCRVAFERLGGALEGNLPIHQDIGPIDQRQDSLGVMLD